MKIGFLGPKGTFTEQATFKYIESLGLSGDKEVVCVEYQAIEDVLLSADKKEVDIAVVPFENSTEGVVNATLDNLIFRTELKIIKKIILPISHNFLIKSDTNISDIKKICSHPQALAQCREYLRSNFADIPLISTASTSNACSMAAENPEFGAIGSISCADIYNLKIHSENIQDIANNQTTFIVVERKEEINMFSDNSTLSLVFSGKNKAGTLFKILKIFADRDLNLTHIVSRPIPSKVGEYVFYIDVDTENKLKDIKDSLELLGNLTNFYKILGNYTV